MFLKNHNNKLFKKYVGKYVIDYLRINNNTFFKSPGMEKKNLSISFYNLNLLNFSESLSIQTHISILNNYYESVISSVEKNNGYVVTNNGDELICIHGLIKSDSVYDSCKSEFDVEYIFKKKLEQYGLSEMNFIKCGINTGEILFGAIGDDSRLFISLMGDHVNLTSRMVTSNKIYNIKRIISEYSIK